MPILISAPGVTQANTSTEQLIESVVLYPTIAELAGLPAPQGPQPMDGISMVRVLRDPAVRLRDHAFHAYPKAKLGRAIRTDRYRLVEWKKIGRPQDKAVFELYDYQTDPHETQNQVALQPDAVAALKRILATYPQPVR